MGKTHSWIGGTQGHRKSGPGPLGKQGVRANLLGDAEGAWGGLSETARTPEGLDCSPPGAFFPSQAPGPTGLREQRREAGSRQAAWPQRTSLWATSSGQVPGLICEWVQCCQPHGCCAGGVRCRRRAQGTGWQGRGSWRVSESGRQERCCEVPRCSFTVRLALLGGWLPIASTKDTPVGMAPSRKGRLV